MTYTPKTTADQVVGGWADFANPPSNTEIFRRRLAADGITKPNLKLADVAIEEIPNGSHVIAIFGGRKESYYKVDGEWENAGIRKTWDSAWIVRNVLKSENAGSFVLEVPMSEWVNFQK